MRLIMDNNVWATVARTKSKASLERWSTASGWQICTPPATLLEMLRDSNPERLRANIGALTSKQWIRLPTEAEMEAAEVVAEAKRIRPDWVRQFSLPAEPARLRKFWTHKIWRSVASDPVRFAAQRKRPAESLEAVERVLFKSLKLNREERIAHNWRPGSLDEILVYPRDDVPDNDILGWDERKPVEWWRVEACDVYRQELKGAVFRKAIGADTTAADWLYPYLWPNSVTRDWADFTRFWLFDVHKTNMPRNWIRWAISVAQGMGKIKQSDLRDGQLASYLVDCDVFLTEDKKFANALGMVRASCPVSMAEVRHIKTLDTDIPVTEIIEAALT